MFAFLAAHRREVFPTELFADLFPSSTGRPNLPGEVVSTAAAGAGGLSDRDAVAAVRWDIRWKVTCGLPLDHEGFHPSTLTYLRRRLDASDRPDRIFVAVRSVIAGTGVLRARRCGRWTRWYSMTRWRRKDTVTQLIALIRRVRREVFPALQASSPPGAARMTTTTRTSRRSPGTTRPRDALASALVNDAAVITGPLDGEDLDEGPPWSPGRTWSLRRAVTGTDGRWRIAREGAADRVISTVESLVPHGATALVAEIVVGRVGDQAVWGTTVGRARRGSRPARRLRTARTAGNGIRRRSCGRACRRFAGADT